MQKRANQKFILCLGEPLILTEGTLTIRIKTDPETNYVYSTASGLKILSKVISEAQASLTSSASGGVTVQGVALHFTGIIVDGIERCKVTEESVKTELLRGVPEGKEKLLFKPATGEALALIKLENNGGTCIAAGSFLIKLTEGKGGVLCTAPMEATRAEQLLTCKGVELKFDEEACTFEGSFLDTLSKSGVAQQWAIIEGK